MVRSVRSSAMNLRMQSQCLVAWLATQCRGWGRTFGAEERNRGA